MKRAFGCPVPDEAMSSLVEYLVSQNTIQPEPTEQTVQAVIAEEPSPDLSRSSGDTNRGGRVFGKYCMNCHGTSGKGDGPIGRSLVPPAANLTVLGKKSDHEILKTIQAGRPGTAMPSWKNDLTPQEIRDVLAYIRTLGS
jgi:mono/diheme cytochrome c family protein